MKIKLDADRLSALERFLENWEDAELLGAKGGRKEYVADFYDLARPVSMDVILGKDAIFADGAAYLKYDEELDGWYISEPIEDGETVLAVLAEAGAFGA